MIKERAPMALGRIYAMLMAFLTAAANALETATLTAEETHYVRQGDPVTLCVDPDWEPFEWIDENGEHQGIAADLIRLVAARTGLRISLYPTSTWEETLDASRAGQCQLLSFINQTPTRDEWLIFTEPLFLDPNVIITHTQHPDIVDPPDFAGKTIALPAGTMLIERIRQDYPELEVIPTLTEEEAISLVSTRMVDMSVRSLIVAAHTIRKAGWFNLKIAGRMPDYANVLRIGVLKDEVLLRDILDKGIATLSRTEREEIANRHAGVTFNTPVDYRIVWEMAVIAVLMVGGLLLHQRHSRRLNAIRLEHARLQLEHARRAREEQSRLVAMLSHEVKTPLAIIDGAAQSLSSLIPPSRPEVARRIDRIRRGVSRLELLTRQFLHKDRLDDESLHPRRLAFNLAALVTDVIEDLGADPRIQVSEMPQSQVFGDPALIQIALQNLVGNAQKYSPPNTPIWVSANVQNDHISLSVRDEGPTIPAALRDQIFRRYVRGDQGETVPGAGLGLYLVGRVAELHGGTAYLAPTTPGNEFVLQWPGLRREQTPPSAEPA